MKSKFCSLAVGIFLVGCNDSTMQGPETQVDKEAKSSSSGHSSQSISPVNGGQIGVLGPISKALNPAPCIATFTENYSVMSYFDDLIFEVKKGESFVVESGPEFFGKTTLYKEAEGQMIDFDLEGELADLPLTFNCDIMKAGKAFVNFKKLDFYNDAYLTEKVCSLPLATVLSTSETGYAVALSAKDKTVYEMFPTNTQPGCTGGQFVKAEEFELFDTYYTRAALGAYLVKP